MSNCDIWPAKKEKKTAPIYCFAFLQLENIIYILIDSPHCHPQHIFFHQHTRDILGLCEEFVPGNPPEFFFDRNPENFGTILEMYRYLFTELKSHHHHDCQVFYHVL